MMGTQQKPPPVVFLAKPRKEAEIDNLKEG
ncbi:hypothetical protein SAMN05443244_0961 [Terriglobus roseus]|uniref:Uncharacterized protein n=1 Tax=Terriglobus roseus TaxID=392734 RepID=A0A1H4K2F0_9BACT|nr:hypothetical protein SAMN05443244_0961 [Terriglobus roseus]